MQDLHALAEKKGIGALVSKLRSSSEIKTKYSTFFFDTYSPEVWYSTPFGRYLLERWYRTQGTRQNFVKSLRNKRKVKSVRIFFLSFIAKADLLVVLDLFKIYKKWDGAAISAELVQILANINCRNVKLLTADCFPADRQHFPPSSLVFPSCNHQLLLFNSFNNILHLLAIWAPSGTHLESRF